ncbi:MAG: DUF4625 domain-containing protein [Bacteroidota bacterium]
MNTKLLTTLSIFVLALMVLVSCNEDDDFSAPAITDLEIGHENSKVGYPGSQLHIEAMIVAEGRIDQIVVEIHPEGNHHHKSGQGTDNGHQEWDFEYIWTEFNGLLNTTFHEHIEIPLEAGLGHYHFHLQVIDMQGKTTVLETEFEVKEPQEGN